MKKNSENLERSVEPQRLGAGLQRVTLTELGRHLTEVYRHEQKADHGTNLAHARHLWEASC